MNIPTCKLKSIDLQDRQILVRADLNISDTSSFRLKALLPTLTLLKKKGARITLIGHRGRPTNNEIELSLEPLASWFEKQNFTTKFCPTVENAKLVAKKKLYDIVLLENLRFLKGEQTEDPEFACQLKGLGSFFVQDAFGVLHRSSASITTLPTLFKKEERSIGLLVEKELILLHNFSKTKHSFILGGNKVATKLPLIRQALKKADYVFVCPPLSFTFEKSQGKEIGNSLYDANFLDEAKDLLKNRKVILPVDYITTSGNFDSPTILSEQDNITSEQVGITIGRSTLALFAKKLAGTSAIFMNAAMGNEDHPQTLSGMKGLLDILAQLPGKKVFGGGDTISYVQKLGYDESIGSFSTGGGATLTYLCTQPLVGLIPFM